VTTSVKAVQLPGFDQKIGKDLYHIGEGNLGVRRRHIFDGGEKLAIDRHFRVVCICIMQ
jgi:hypothetical protein